MWCEDKFFFLAQLPLGADGYEDVN